LAKGSKMRNLFYRIITVLVLLPLVLTALIIGGYYLALLLSLAGLLSCFEIAGIINPKNIFAKIFACIFFTGLFLPAIFIKDFIFLAFLVPMIFIFNAIILFTVSITRDDFEKYCAIFYWSFYALLGLACINWLSNSPIYLNERIGLSFIFLACLATWGNDSFALFGGRIFGKTPLFKRVSQKKTWEGFFCGAFFSLVLVLLFKYVPLTWGQDWLYGLALSDLLWVTLPAIILAPFGDLIESKLKRFYNAKDSSQILPGHGGLLDRIDGLLTIMPWTALYAFFIRSIW
jgi:phosphatidate cytidylyltransferase